MQTFRSTIHPNEPLTPYKKHFKFRVSKRRSSEQVHRLGRLNFKGGSKIAAMVLIEEVAEFSVLTASRQREKQKIAP